MKTLEIIKFAFLNIWLFVVLSNADSGAMQLDNENFNTTLDSNELVFVLFYVDWDRFSNSVMPIFNEAADKTNIVLGKLDCDDQTEIAERFNIFAYPTFKLFRNGQVSKRKYKGNRTLESFLTFVDKEIEDPMIEFNSLDELDPMKRIIIGYFDEKDTVEYETFKKVARNLQETCHFYIGLGNVTAGDYPSVEFRPDVAVSNENNETYSGNLTNFDELKEWSATLCTPLVRVITQENLYEFEDENIPLLILFHSKNDTESVKDYKTVVEEQLLSEKENVNFFTSIGENFRHILYHLGKNENETDLPFIVLNDIRHRYLFPNFKDMYTSGKLKDFLSDLYSGKLHKEFHYPRSKTTDFLFSNGQVSVVLVQPGLITCCLFLLFCTNVRKIACK